MDSARRKLIKGAVKSGLAALSGVSIGGNIIDPNQFSLITFHGAMHALELTAIVVGVAEARYFKQWLEKWSETDDDLQQSLSTAADATAKAKVAIDTAQTQAGDVAKPAEAKP